MLFSSLSFFLWYMYLGNKIQKLWLLSVAVTCGCLRALPLRVLLHALGICARDKVMLTRILITFPSSSNSEHQWKTQEWQICSETMMLHPHPLPLAVSERETGSYVLPYFWCWQTWWCLFYWIKRKHNWRQFEFYFFLLCMFLVRVWVGGAQWYLILIALAM